MNFYIHNVPNGVRGIRNCLQPGVDNHFLDCVISDERPIECLKLLQKTRYPSSQPIAQMFADNKNKYFSWTQIDRSKWHFQVIGLKVMKANLDCLHPEFLGQYVVWSIQKLFYYMLP